MVYLIKSEMEILKIENFLSYCEKTREATNKVIQVISHEKLDWTCKADKFTIGNLVRHIAAIKRHVFAEMAIGYKANYKGCGKKLADGYENVDFYFNMRLQAIEIFMLITDESF